MKISFNDKWEAAEEKAILKHILFEFWRNYDDPLGCEPACRDLSSPSCDACVERWIDKDLKNNELNLCLMLGSPEWVKKHKILKFKEEWDE